MILILEFIFNFGYCCIVLYCSVVCYMFCPFLGLKALFQLINVIFWSYQDCCSCFNICLYILSHHIHITDGYIKNLIVYRICDCTNSRLFNTVAISVPRYLVKHIVIFDVIHIFQLNLRLKIQSTMYNKIPKYISVIWFSSLLPIQFITGQTDWACLLVL